MMPKIPDLEPIDIEDILDDFESSLKDGDYILKRMRRALRFSKNGQALFPGGEKPFEKVEDDIRKLKNYLSLVWSQMKEADDSV